MRRLSLALSVAGALVAASSTLRAQLDPATLHAHGQLAAELVPLPPFDVRHDERGLPDERVRAALERAWSASERAARAFERERLAREVPQLTWTEHELFGTPRSVGSTLAFLTPPSALAPFDVLRGFVARHPANFGFAAAELTRAELVRETRDAKSGITYLEFQQRVDGRELVGCRLEAQVSARGELIHVASAWLPPAAVAALAPGLRGALDASSALQLAALDVRAPFAAAPELVDARDDGPSTWAAGEALDALPAPTTEALVFPRTRSELVPAWRVRLMPRGGDWYEVLVSALDGRILARQSHTKYLGGTEDLSLRVFTSDGVAPGSPGPATPTGAQFPVVARDLVLVRAADVLPWSPQGWIPDGQNETLGNNVDAHTDLDFNHLPDLPRPAGSPYRVFDPPFNAAQAPSSWRAATVTQVFYLANRFHDHVFELGFDEAFGNFQDLNFSGQGVGGDRLSADCQDGGGANNARFITLGGDGSFARTEMFLFTNMTPDRDGGLEAAIVYHELTHGVSVRLHNATLGGQQSGGLGEGWSDFFGLSLVAEPGDDLAGSHAMGGYTALSYWGGFDDNYYCGIRRFPYSTDLAKNPLTYADIDPAQVAFPPGVPRNTNGVQTANTVHNVGEVWCSILWELRARFLATHGARGDALLQELLIQGMKLSVDNPNFVEARDAILQADLALHAGAHLGDLWSGFARRGLGFSASSPAGGTSASGVQEAFDLPALVLFDFPDGRARTTGPATREALRVDIQALGGQQLLPGTAFLDARIDNGAPSSVALTEIAPGAFAAELPAADCGATIRWSVRVDSTFGPARAPENGEFELAVANGVTTVLQDDFEAAGGWSGGQPGDTASTGLWTRADPVGTVDGGGLEVQPEFDWSAAPGTRCWFTGQGVAGGSAGASDVDGGTTTLLSPNFDLTGVVAPRFAYWRWYSNAAGSGPAEDVLRVDVSNNGGTDWVPVEVVGPASQNVGGWIRSEFFVADFVAPSNAVRLRFVAEDAGTSSLVEAAIDDFSLIGGTCQALGGNFCAGDGSLATPCPCGNFGAARRGCANSAAPQGSFLRALGSTQPDTIVLRASSVPTSSPVLFFQGDESRAAGLVLGDGVGCVTGSIVRLGTRTASQGVSELPGPGDAPLSTLGGVLPGSGALRFYQAHYRNAAQYCTSATFNVTNGWALVW